jgi:hypothetical protein
MREQMLPTDSQHAINDVLPLGTGSVRRASVWAGRYSNV